MRGRERLWLAGAGLAFVASACSGGKGADEGGEADSSGEFDAEWGQGSDAGVDTAPRDALDDSSGSADTAELGGDGGSGDDAESSGDADAASSGDDGSSGDAGAGGCLPGEREGELSYACGDLKFDLTVPDGCDGGGCGLIVDVHGLSMNGRMEDNNTGMRSRGREHGFLVLQPTAWGAPPTTSWDGARDDVHVYEMILAVMDAWEVDPERVHFMGFSQGGAMTWRFLCAHSELFASVSPGAMCSEHGEGGCFSSPELLPAREVPILYLAGRQDALVPYECMEGQRDQVIAAWEMGEPEVVSADESHEWVRYTNPRGVAFEMISHNYAAEAPLILGHCYPGSDDYEPQVPGQVFGFACLGENAFSWGEAAMQFFLAHPRTMETP